MNCGCCEKGWRSAQGERPLATQAIMVRTPRESQAARLCSEDAYQAAQYLARISHQGRQGGGRSGCLPEFGTGALNHMARPKGLFRVRKSKTAPGDRGPFGAALNSYCLAGSTMIRPRPRLSR